MRMCNGTTACFLLMLKRTETRCSRTCRRHAIYSTAMVPQSNLIVSVSWYAQTVACRMEKEQPRRRGRSNMSIEHRIRTPDGEPRTVRLTPRSAIKAQCLECMGWQRAEVARCTSTLCPLYPFRRGNAHSGKVGRPRRPKKATQRPDSGSGIDCDGWGYR